MATHDQIGRDLEELHAEYTFRVNSAVDESREDLIPALVDAYTDEALELIRAAGA